MLKILGYVACLCVVLAPFQASATVFQPVLTASPQQIASGQDYWVDSKKDPQFQIINAQVNLGNLREIALGVYDVEMRWPMSFDVRKYWQTTYPELNFGAKAYTGYTERITCHLNYKFFVAYQSALFSEQGELLKAEIDTPEQAKLEKEKLWADINHRLGRKPDPSPSYGSDPRSLVCWAAAQKCRGQSFYWPPPPNDTPWKAPDREIRNGRYNQMFVPDCHLK